METIIYQKLCLVCNVKINTFIIEHVFMPQFITILMGFISFLKHFKNKST